MHSHMVGVELLKRNAGSAVSFFLFPAGSAEPVVGSDVEHCVRHRASMHSHMVGVELLEINAGSADPTIGSTGPPNHGSGTRHRASCISL